MNEEIVEKPYGPFAIREDKLPQFTAEYQQKLVGAFGMNVCLDFDILTDAGKQFLYPYVGRISDFLDAGDCKYYHSRTCHIGMSVLEKMNIFLYLYTVGGGQNWKASMKIQDKYRRIFGFFDRNHLWT